MTVQQGILWPDRSDGDAGEVTPVSPVARPIVGVQEEGRRTLEESKGRSRHTIQDLLFDEGLLAARFSAHSDSLEALQRELVNNFRQNSLQTRTRYARSVLQWFFSDGLDGLARSVWAAYEDEKIESDILRYLYLSTEPIMGACVAQALYPLEDGMLVPPNYFDRFLAQHFGDGPPPKTRDRLKSNLMRLGFLARTRGKPDRLTPVVPQKTSFLVLLHHLFAPNSVRAVELRTLFGNPFWKYLGYKSEDAVRNLLREADAAGVIGKYVVADQIEQVTTCCALNEWLERGMRL